MKPRALYLRTHRRWKAAAVLLSAIWSVAPLSASAQTANQTPPPNSTLDAQAQPVPGAADTTPPQQSGNVIESYFANWRAMATAAQAAQPRWSSPIVTTTALLEDRFRFDVQSQQAGNNTSTLVLDGGKGLDAIVGPTTEVQVALDPYYIRSSDLLDYKKNLSDSKKGELDGFADWPFFRLKERLASSPESEGDYVVSAWLQLQADSGIAPLTNHAFTLLPTLGFGKGWGPLILQGTVGATIPTAHESTTGTQLTNNMALQYNVGRYFWPQIETNLTYWTDGTRGRKTQLFLTPGLVIGRFDLTDQLHFTTGAGYSFAVSPHYQSSPLLPSYNHAWIITTRLSF